MAAKTILLGRMQLFVSDARRFGLVRAVYGKGVAALRKAGILYLNYQCLYVGKNSYVSRPAPQYPGLECREIRIETLRECADDPTYEIGAEFLRSIANRRDRCWAAYANGRMVGYAFLASQPTQVDEFYRFHFSHDWRYAYKVFTLPSWRGKGIQGWLIGQAFGAVTQEGDVAGMVTLVLAQNFPSLTLMAKQGFKKLHEFRTVQLPGLRAILFSSARSSKNSPTSCHFEKTTIEVL